MEGMSTKGQIIKGKPVADKISQELIIYLMKEEH